MSKAHRRLAIAPITVLGMVMMFGLSACGNSYQAGPVTNSSPCGVVNADQAGGDTTDITNYETNQIESSAPEQMSLEAVLTEETQVGAPFLGECLSNPSELAASAWSKGISASLASTTGP